MGKNLIKWFALAVAVLVVGGLLAYGLMFQSHPATAEAETWSPDQCNADNSVVNIARSTALAKLGQTISFTVSAGNPSSVDGCDIVNRVMTLTLPNGSTHTFGPYDYPNPASVSVVGSADYVADINDLDGNKWTATVSWTGTQYDGFDSSSTGFKETSVNYVPDLQISKTATPAIQQGYEWNIEKSVTPAEWFLFDGDTATSEYTVAVTRSTIETGYSVTGTITVKNNANISATIISVTDSISGGINATVDCGANFPIILGGGQTLNCTYSADLPDKSARTNTVTVTTSGTISGGSATAEIDFTGVVPTDGNGSVIVKDSVKGTLDTISDSQTFTYTDRFSCMEDEGVNNNVATIIANNDGQTELDQDSAMVTVHCYDLDVTKTADTTFDRKYTWDVAKDADKTEVTINEGESVTVNYTVTASVTGTSDTNRSVSGEITVHNGSPMSATINSVSDSINEVGPVSVNCPVSFPYILASGANLVCTYTSALTENTSRTNTVTVTQQNYSYDKLTHPTASGTTQYTGTANISFDGPTNVVDEQVTVTDTYGGTLGTVSASNAPVSFTYSRTETYTGEGACGDHTINNTATIVTNDTSTQDSASANVLVHVMCGTSCTYTVGYWKTHSKYGPASYDDVWGLMGDYDGDGTKEYEDETFFKSGMTYYQIMSSNSSNGVYYSLARQFIAAGLNYLSGADFTAAQTAWNSALHLFQTYTPQQAQAMKGNAKAQWTDLYQILANYNEGLIGPGHCYNEPLPM